MNLSTRWGDYGASNYRYTFYSNDYFNKVYWSTDGKLHWNILQINKKVIFLHVKYSKYPHIELKTYVSQECQIYV